jgi:hypothetical protein
MKATFSNVSAHLINTCKNAYLCGHVGEYDPVRSIPEMVDNGDCCDKRCNGDTEPGTGERLEFYV